MARRPDLRILLAECGRFWHDVASMNRFVSHLWTYSPRDWWGRARYRLDPSLKAIATPQWVRVRGGPIAGAELFLAEQAVDTWKSMADGTFDGFLLQELVRRDWQGATMWDVGSHFGYHALCFSALVGESGSVVAFEPNQQNCGRIRMHMERNHHLSRRIRLEPVAVADQSGELTFVSSPHLESGESTGSHLVTAQTPSADESYVRFRPETVLAVSIDDYLDRGHSRPPAVIKIDVEGAESLVLKGAGRLLGEHKPLLLLEIHHILQMFEIQPMLQNLGYRLTVLDREHASASRCFLLAQ